MAAHGGVRPPVWRDPRLVRRSRSLRGGLRWGRCHRSLLGRLQRRPHCSCSCSPPRALPTSALRGRSAAVSQGPWPPVLDRRPGHRGRDVGRDAHIVVEAPGRCVGCPGDDDAVLGGGVGLVAARRSTTRLNLRVTPSARHDVERSRDRPRAWRRSCGSTTPGPVARVCALHRVEQVGGQAALLYVGQRRHPHGSARR
jgi:hypothetical protein